MSNFVFIYTTVANKDEATRIGKSLVESHLAACVNILAEMTSFYWWNGVLEQSQEVVLIAKSQAHLSEPLIKHIRQLHSYACPCIVTLPISGGNPDFLQWITQETTTPPTSAK